MDAHKNNNNNNLQSAAVTFPFGIRIDFCWNGATVVVF